MSSFGSFLVGTLADPGSVNNNFNILSKQIILSKLSQNFSNVGNLYYTGENFVSEFLTQRISTPASISKSWVDTTNTTCYYDEYGIVGFCDRLDLFDTGSVNTGIWSIGSNLTGAFGSVQHNSSGFLHISVGGASSVPTGSAHANSSGASGLNLNGSNTEIIFSYYSDASNSSGATGTTDIKVQLTDGTTNITLLTLSQVTSPSQSVSGSGTYRLFYNNTLGSVYIDSIGSVSTSNVGSVAVGAITNKYLRFQGSCHSTGVGDSTTANLYLFGVGYQQNGASNGSVSFVTSAYNTEYTSSAGIIFSTWHKGGASGSAIAYPTGSVFSNITFNNSTSFGTKNSYGSWIDGLTTGSVMRIKISVPKTTTITSGSHHIPIMTSWGVLTS